METHMRVISRDGELMICCIRADYVCDLESNWKSDEITLSLSASLISFIYLTRLFSRKREIRKPFSAFTVKSLTAVEDDSLRILKCITLDLTHTHVASRDE